MGQEVRKRRNINKVRGQGEVDINLSTQRGQPDNQQNVELPAKWANDSMHTHSTDTIWSNKLHLSSKQVEQI